VIVYADTSALAKLFWREEGSERMLGVAEEAEAIGSVAIGYVELRASAARALRDGRIAPRERERVLDAIDRLWQQVTEIAVERPLIRQAGDFAEQMRLRAYDAVHLAALRLLGEPDQVAFACWDADLRAAARQLGYTLIPA